MKLLRLQKDEAMLRETDGLSLVDKSFIEESIAYWDRAAATQLPDIRPSGDERGTFVPLEETLSAPRADAVDIVPAEVYHYDGSIPLSSEDLTRVLAAEAKSVLRTEVDIRIDGIGAQGVVPAARVYVFRDPVHEAISVSGRLVIPHESGDADWQPGTPATLLVEIIESKEAMHKEPVRELLSCRVEGGVARWSKA